MKIYFDNGEPAPVYVDDLTPLPPAPAPTERVRRQRRTLTPWQGFVVCATMMAGVALLLREVVLRTGGNQAGGTFIVVFVAGVALLAALGVRAFAHRAGWL